MPKKPKAERRNKKKIGKFAVLEDDEVEILHINIC